MTCGREIGYTCSANPVLTDPGCDEHFGSLEAFDRHLRGDDRRCMTTRMMLARGFRRKANGSWSTSATLDTPEQTSLRLREGRTKTIRKKARSARRRAKTVSVASTTRPPLDRESEGGDRGLFA